MNTLANGEVMELNTLSSRPPPKTVALFRHLSHFAGVIALATNYPFEHALYWKLDPRDLQVPRGYAQVVGCILIMADGCGTR